MTTVEQPPTPEPEQPKRSAELAPQPSRIIAEPATVETCRADYDAAATARTAMDKTVQRTR